jgi:hypothetical protein
MKLSVCCLLVTLLVFPLSAAAQMANGKAAAPSASADVPRVVKFSGTATDETGKPISGAVGVTFALYKDQQGGAPLWVETQNVQADASGHYTAMLGASTSNGVPVEIFASGDAQWLGVQIHSQPEKARVLLVSVPYALKAHEAETLSGRSISDFVLLNKTASAASSAGNTSSRSNGTSDPSLPPNGPTNFVGSNATQIVGVTQKGSGTGLAATATTHAAVAGTITGKSNTAVYGLASNTSKGSNAAGVTGVANTDTGPGVQGVSPSPNGFGVQGINNASTGFAPGVSGSTQSASGVGVFGYNNATSGSGNGVNGGSASPSGIGVQGYVVAPGGIGVLGNNNATSGGATGVLGVSASPSGTGVSGNATATTGSAEGVYGQSSAPNGVGVNGVSTSTTGNGIGVTGSSLGTGVFGYTTTTTGSASGVLGTTGSTSGNGVSGNANATTGNANGVYGQSASPNGIGVAGTNSASSGGVGVNGSATATSGNTIGVFGGVNSPTGQGVFGNSTATSGGNGVLGQANSANGFGVFGINNAAGGFAVSSANTATGTGVSLAGNVVIVAFNGNKGLFSVDNSGNGSFAGNLNVTGKLTKGSGSFKIDHPLDPANKYLSHSFVESPDMMNVYNGNVTTDRHGLATVVLPDYFESLNGDFRYQLTVMGKFAQAIVAKEIANNRFVIRTNKPDVKVSWQVTGVRHDAYANAYRIPTEEDKPAAEQGYYLHPEVFGQPASKSIQAASQRVSPTDQLAKILTP